MPTTIRNIRRYGWKPDFPDFRDAVYKLSASSSALPESVDLRPKLPPVYDQGQLGSCTGNSTAGALEFQYKKQGLPEVVPSRLFIYYNGRSVEGTTDQDSGCQIRDVIKQVAACGACPETEWPYDITQFAVKPTAKCYTDAAAEVVLKYSSVPQTLTHLQDALASHIPVVIGFTVYSGFESQEVAESGHLNLPTSDETVVGGHAVLVVGYDNANQWFIVRNSWGADWGLNGYFTMPYNYLLNPNLASDFWAIKLIK